MEYLQGQDLSSIRKFTGNLYDYPPEVWLRLTCKSGKYPSITPTDRIILRYLYKGAKFDPATSHFTFVTSIRGIAKCNLLDKKTVWLSVERLKKAGAIEVEPTKKGSLSAFHIRHFESADISGILEEVGIITQKKVGAIRQRGGGDSPTVLGKSGGDSPPV